MSYNNLGIIYLSQGKLEEAHSKALEIRLKVLGAGASRRRLVVQ